MLLPHLYSFYCCCTGNASFVGLVLTVDSKHIRRCYAERAAVISQLFTCLFACFRYYRFNPRYVCIYVYLKCALFAECVVCSVSPDYLDKWPVAVCLCCVVCACAYIFV